MTASKFDALAGRLLERVQSREMEAPTAEERARAIASIERAILQKNRRRLAKRAIFAAAAAALLGLGTTYFALHREPHPTATVPSVAAAAARGITVVGHPAGAGATVVEIGSEAPLVDGQSLAPGSRILARPNGHVVLAVSTGSRLTVEEAGDVSLVEAGSDQVFAIGAGAVRADVAKLEAGKRFIIRTPDSEVEVRGTSFRVSVVDVDPTCEDGTVTRVSVYEGVVSVRHAGEEARVRPGQNWPSGCFAQPEALPAPRNKGRVAAVPMRAPVLEVPSDPVITAQIASDLREQNDCFAKAFAAKQRGANGEAIEGFDTFLARYPSSSLAESALAQRMQLVRGVDPTAAARTARQYLARYPRGFARAEAEAIERLAP